MRAPDPVGDPAGLPDDAHRTRRQAGTDARLMALWDRLRDLDLVVERVETERQSVDVSSEFTRVTTTVVLMGRGQEGRGEDVTYNAEDHAWFPAIEPGATTLGDFSRTL